MLHSLELVVKCINSSPMDCFQTYPVQNVTHLHLYSTFLVLKITLSDFRPQVTSYILFLLGQLNVLSSWERDIFFRALAVISLDRTRLFIRSCAVTVQGSVMWMT